MIKIIMANTQHSSMVFQKGHKTRIGIKHSEESKKKMSDAAKKRIGEKNSFFGKHHSQETIEKIILANTGRPVSEYTRNKRSKSMKGKNLGENNGWWAGDNITYIGLHIYMHKHLPKPEFCQICEEVEPTQVACITGIYNRDFDNWQWLCIPCHSVYDNIGQMGRKPGSYFKRDPKTGRFIT